MTRRARAANRDSDCGTSLVELLVTMTLMTIVGALATTFFITSLKSTEVSSDTNQSSGELRTTLDSWTAMLRVAGWLDPASKSDRFEEITPTKIVFFTNLGNRTDPSNGTVLAGSTVQDTTKVALLLRQRPDGSSQLVQVIFGADNTSVAQVRQLSVDATTPASGWMFTPYDQTGGAVDMSQSLCISSGSGAAPGLCLSAPSGAGMLDPSIGSDSLAVTSGPLRGDGSADSILSHIGRIGITVAATNTSTGTPSEYTTSASVSSGFPS